MFHLARMGHLPMSESVKLHGVAHVVVENQVAMGDPSASLPPREARRTSNP
jgi:hypothetical protein